jgi:hypothetical protein
MDRRQFLGIGSIFLLNPSISKAALTGKPNTFFPSHREKLIFTAAGGPPLSDLSNNFYVAFLDLNSFKITFIPSPVSYHSFVQNPRAKNQIIGIEKWGSRMALFNGESCTLSKTIKIEWPKQFVGHGDFSTDGKRFYVSVSHYEESDPMRMGHGKIQTYDTETLSLIDEFSTFGFEPHQISFFQDHELLLVLHPGYGKTTPTNPIESLTNHQGPYLSGLPSISVLDMKTRTLFKNFFINQETRLAHLSKLSEEKFFLIGGKTLLDGTWENQAFLFTLEKGPSPLPGMGKGLPIPLLSAAHSKKSGVLAATSPEGEFLLLWRDEVLKTLPMTNCDGICSTSDGEYFVVTHENFISIIDANNLKEIRKEKLAFLQSGEHCLVYNMG